MAEWIIERLEELREVARFTSGGMINEREIEQLINDIKEAHNG